MSRVQQIKAMIPVASKAATAAQQELLAKATAMSLEPWEQCPEVWKTKAAFFLWMRVV